jgi:hypothetical protein
MRSSLKILARDHGEKTDLKRRVVCCALIFSTFGISACTSVAAKNKGLNLKFIRFKPPLAIEISRILRERHGWNDLRVASVQTSQRVFVFSHFRDVSSWESQLMDALMSVGVNTAEVRTEFFANTIIVENLGA